MKSIVLNLFLSIGLCGLLLPPLSGEKLHAAVAVTLVDVEGKSHSGTLAGMTGKEILLSLADQPQTFDTAEVLELRFDHKRIKPHLSTATIFLANGDRLAARPESMDDTKAIAHWEMFPGWPPIEVPLETITGFILDMPEIAAVRSEALRTVLERKQNTDLVNLKNGDQAGGEFLGMTETTLRIDGPVGETAIDRRSIRLATMNRELISFPAHQGAAVLFLLTDGSKITATDVSFDGQQRLKLKAAFGAEMDLPLSAVVSARCLGGRAVYLSDVSPTLYEHKPYLAGGWELSTDRNILGEPMHLDGQEFPKGLGMHSQSLVSYDLKGEYETFRATIGVDDSAGNQGSVVFVVEVDGQEQYRSEPQTAREKAISLAAIPLRGAKRLMLKVEFAEFGDARDYANWCDAVLLR
jgi:hypothetical protein